MNDQQRTTAQGHVVTPTLFLGDLVAAWPDAVRTETVEGAVFLIDTGRTAFLPAGRWDVAAEVLQALGLARKVVDSRLKTALPCTYEPSSC